MGRLLEEKKKIYEKEDFMFRAAEIMISLRFFYIGIISQRDLPKDLNE